MTSNNRRKKEHAKKLSSVKKKASSTSPMPYLYACLVGLLAVGVYYFYNELTSISEILRPFGSPFVKECSLFTEEYHNQMLWGTYRPGLYFGLRMRTPSSLLAGLMWTDASWYQNIDHLRHLARQEDGIRYGWNKHNGKDLGIQHIQDGDMLIETSWVKRIDPETGIGGDWALRVSAKDKDSEKRNHKVAFFFYIADENGPELSAKNELGWEMIDESLNKNSKRMLSGKHHKIGSWELDLYSTQLHDLKIHHLGVPVEMFHNLTEQVIGFVYEQLNFQYHSQEKKNFQTLVMSLPDPPVWWESAMEHPNFAVFQITGTLPFEFEFAFLTGDHEDFSPRFQSFSGTNLDQILQQKSQNFDAEFEERLSKNDEPPDQAEARKEVLSNVLGSIGYFYGSSQIKIIKEKQTPKIKEHFETTLLTGTPSRSFFPRGFLWDEGFHQVEFNSHSFSHSFMFR